MEEQPVVAPQQEVVVEQPQPTVIVQRADPIMIEEESVSSRLRYDKSFTAKLIQSEDEVKYWYTEIKNELLSYKGVKGRISWKRETFKCGGKLVLAKLAYRGKMLCLFLPLNVADYDEEYHVESASESCYEDTPCMIRLKNRKRVKIALKLISNVMEQNAMVQVPNYVSEDFYMPYEGILELIKKGLIKRELRTPQDEAIFEKDSATAATSEEDETFELKQVAPGIYVTKKE